MSMQEPHASKWPDLAIALAAHRAGSLAGAATKLGVDPSTASRRLSALEKHLGAALFHRTPEGLTGTALWEEVLPHAQTMEVALKDMERLAFGAQVQVQGTVRLACAEGVAIQVLAPRLTALREEHPGLQLELSTGFDVADLTRREADLALRFVRPARGDLVFRRLRDVVIRPFVAKTLLEQLGPIETPEQLPWVGPSAALGHLPEAQWMRAHVAADPVVRSNSYVFSYVAACEGVGATLISEAAGKAAPELVPVPLDLPALAPLQMFLVTHRALRRVPRVEVAWDWVERCVEEVFAGVGG